jgi:penicillin-insensitive murein endopeptidase
MNVIRPLVVLLWLAWLLPAQAGDNTWSRLTTPLAGPPQAIGSYSAGCLAGGLALPLVGQGYQIMRPSRNRYYGHPALLQLIERLGRQAATRGQRLLIGDLSQPRGGPMSSGHSSHQVGLDVDIWFEQVASLRTLSRQETENLPMRSVVVAAEGALDAARWSPRYRESLRMAANAPEVERIFVNPVIKRVLCLSETGDRDWLRKLRPWWGHDAHFHIRLRCPADSLLCETQKPLPPGDGCDEKLDEWIWEIQQAVLSPKPRRETPERKATVLPVACEAVLNRYAVNP